MSVLRKRDRQIAFRVSDDEYRALQIACLETRARSISDLAREATKMVAATRSLSAPGSPASEILSRLDQRMANIEEAIERVLQGLNEIRDRSGIAG